MMYDVKLISKRQVLKARRTESDRLQDRRAVTSNARNLKPACSIERLQEEGWSTQEHPGVRLIL
ncbi:hypothetical protein KEJ39_03950 [Candidatus Bathyarchaeota archaeon]|nr:hypothetical protein [Candidatus Bathyarchaeota archaeon]